MSQWNVELGLLFNFHRSEKCIVYSNKVKCRTSEELEIRSGNKQILVCNPECLASPLLMFS
jgi:hypothetical protein